MRGTPASLSAKKSVSAPIAEAVAARLCGVVTDRDICMGAYTKGVALQQIRVAEVMSRPVRTCAPDDTLERAIGIMAEARVRRLPVVTEDQRLMGMISLADIAQSAAHGAKTTQGASPKLGGFLA